MTEERQNAGEGGKSGQLKIFFGYAAGVGKTYAMLQAALTAEERGMDVVIGAPLRRTGRWRTQPWRSGFGPWNGWRNLTWTGPSGGNRI